MSHPNTIGVESAMFVDEEGLELDVSRRPKYPIPQPQETEGRIQRAVRDTLWLQMATNALSSRACAQLTIRPDGRAYSKRHVNRRLKSLCERLGIDRNAIGSRPDLRSSHAG